MKKIFFLLIVMGVTAGCEKASRPEMSAVPANSAPSNEAGKQNVQKPAPEIEDVFAIKSKQFDYTYNPIQKRDPFKPFEGEVTYFEEREKTPLERFDLSQLQITAIIWGIAEPRALVKAPDGQDYIVKKGVRMGRNSGKISRITKKEIVVAEEYRDQLGKLIVRETPLQLNEKVNLDKLLEEIQ